MRITRKITLISTSALAAPLALAAAHAQSAEDLNAQALAQFRANAEETLYDDSNLDPRGEGDIDASMSTDSGEMETGASAETEGTDYLDATGDAAENAWESTKEAAGDAADKTGEWAKDAGEKTKEWAEDSADVTGDAIDDAGDAVKDAADDVEDEMEETDEPDSN